MLSRKSKGTSLRQGEQQGGNNMAQKKSIVALAKEESIQESVSKVFDLLGGVSSLIEKGSTVVMKPNAGHVAPQESAVDTNPEVVRAVIREVRKAEPKCIIIAEAAAIGCDTLECFKACGIQAVAEEEGVKLIDIKREKDLINIPVRGYRSNISHVKLPRFLLEAEHIINLPILKAHASMVFSCALKNIKGVVQDKVHIDMHRENLTMAMMDVWYAVRADINIVDAIYAAGGYSPHTPVPEYVGCILGSKDPVAVDRVACHLSGINPDEVSYFKVAAETRLGSAVDEEIEVVGERVQDHAIKMWVPYTCGMDSWPEYTVLHENACSSCQALLALNMETLKAIGEYDKNTDAVVVVGRKASIPEDISKERLILHGNCTKKWKSRGIFIEGCPPGEGGLKDAIIDRKEYTEETITPEIIAHIEKRKAEVAPIWHDYVMEQAKIFHGKKQ
ncbi:MAG: DUF362 domain-containing protein [Clostridiales Family XIII bacterium]|jgi:uncharacterized protein (DUF362 family)|nr:DUF362 domain-containing protein [Clostridiales Family XIII bacterium]